MKLIYCSKSTSDILGYLCPNQNPNMWAVLCKTWQRTQQKKTRSIFEKVNTQERPDINIANHEKAYEQVVLGPSSGWALWEGRVQMFKGIRKYSQEFEQYPAFYATLIKPQLEPKRDSDVSGGIWKKGSVSLRKPICRQTEKSGRGLVPREGWPRHDEVTQ